MSKYWCLVESSFDLVSVGRKKNEVIGWDRKKKEQEEELKENRNADDPGSVNSPPDYEITADANK